MLLLWPGEDGALELPSAVSWLFQLLQTMIFASSWHSEQADWVIQEEADLVVLEKADWVIWEKSDWMIQEEADWVIQEEGDWVVLEKAGGDSRRLNSIHYRHRLVMRPSIRSIIDSKLTFMAVGFGSSHIFDLAAL